MSVYQLSLNESILIIARSISTIELEYEFENFRGSPVSFPRDSKSSPSEQSRTDREGDISKTRRSHNFQVGFELHKDKSQCKRDELASASSRLANSQIWEFILQ